MLVPIVCMSACHGRLYDHFITVEGSRQTHVVECKVQRPDDEEQSNVVEDERQFLEGSPVDQRAGTPGWQTGLDHEDDEDGADKHDQAHGPYRPAESDSGEQLLCDQREDDTTGSTASGCNGHGEDLSGREVGRDMRDDGRKGETKRQTHAHALRQEQLPVGRGDTGHEGAYELKQTSNKQQGLEIAGVKGAA